MRTDVGEYIVGAYLKIIRECDIVDYNVRSPGGGLQGLGELDVVGYDFKNERAYLCEVTTHIMGLQIGGSYKATVKKIREKHERQKAYAADRLEHFREVQYQFWSPYVPKGYLTDALGEIAGLDLFINGEYTRAVRELQTRARSLKHDAVNPFFRMLQILAALRDD